MLAHSLFSTVINVMLLSCAKSGPHLHRTFVTPVFCSVLSSSFNKQTTKQAIYDITFWLFGNIMRILTVCFHTCFQTNDDIT